VWMGYGLKDRGFESRQGLRIFLFTASPPSSAEAWCSVKKAQGQHYLTFTTASRPAVGPTQPPIQWVPGALSLGIKQPRREADHSHPSSADVKRMRGAIPALLQYVFMVWCLVKHRDNFTFLPDIIKITFGSMRWV
jgi:hypothetical protein